MNFKWIGSAFLCSVMAFACGGGDGGGSGGSGVDEDKLFVDISAAEAGDICEFLLGQAPAFHEVDCGDGTGGTVGFENQAEEDAAIADCTEEFSGVGADFPDCPITVGEVEDCLIAQFGQSDQELCTGADIPACAPLDDPACNPE